MGQLGRKSRLRKRVKRGYRGHPVATVLFYGPDAEFASKISVGIVREGAKELEMHAWHSSGVDVRADRDIEDAVVELFQKEGVKSVTMVDGVSGCPHQQGVDYEGEWCPECPYWRGRERVTGERVH